MASDKVNQEIGDAADSVSAQNGVKPEQGSAAAGEAAQVAERSGGLRRQAELLSTNRV